MLRFNSHNINNNERINMNDLILNEEKLNDLAKTIANNHGTYKKPGNIQRLLKRLPYAFKEITKVYKLLLDKTNQEDEVCPASEWLLDNYYKIEEQYKDVLLQCKKNKLNKLYVLKSGYLKDYPRIFHIAIEMISHTNGKINEDIIIDFIKNYQQYKVLTISELWGLTIIIKIAFIEKIRNLCEEIYVDSEKRKDVDKLNFKDQDLFKQIQININNINDINTTYIEYLIKNLRKSNIDTGHIIDKIDKRLMELNTSIDQVIAKEHKIQAVRKNIMGNSIISLNKLSRLDWNYIFESLSVVEKILREDPIDVYSKMDFKSRDYYRREIEKISSACKAPEVQIAKKAVELSSSYIAQTNDKYKHVGYFLIDEGRNELYKELDSNKRYNKVLPLSFYLTPIGIITFGITILLSMYAYNKSYNYLLSILIALILFIPISEIVVKIFNWIFIQNTSPYYLPKISYKEGVTEEAITFVVIPALLPNKELVKELIRKLEIYYLGNKSENLFFGIVGDFKDSDESKQEEDERIIEEALEGIKELNKNYATNENIFFYFHRERKYNEKQKKWMGWERKRGAIVEFNQLLLGSEDTTFTIISSDMKHIIDKVKYIITLDADTQLTLGMANKLIGTITHPLNKAVRSDKGIIKEGYGLIQPRISLDIESSNVSNFTKVFAGQGGIDAYSIAASDVYQDTFGEGIFTGKGIYDLRIFNSVLKDAVPDNTVLSHDLLEGSYIRAGLASDIELIDGYPSKYSNYINRLHRWVRGDWQLIKWLFPKVKNKLGERVKNPLSGLSRWKIFDNLRRSLAPVCQLLLIIFGLTIFPGKSIIWFGIALLSIACPLIIEVLNSCIHRHYKSIKQKFNCNILYGIKAAFYQMILLFIFLPYEGYMMIDSIIRTLYRIYISKKNLLEWTTAAEAEKKFKNDLKSSVIRMKSAIIIALIFGILVSFMEVNNYMYAIPISFLWIMSPVIAYFISKEIKDYKDMSDEDKKILRRLALKTWDYYQDNTDEDNNYLPPDNYQEDPPNGVANRTSPTNIGFHLLAIIAARDLGYITFNKMIKNIRRTLTTVENIDKWKGHLYNWYDTTSLEVLKPAYVSTVDSGNFVGFLIALKQSLTEYVNKPIIYKDLLNGLEDREELLNEKTLQSLIKEIISKKSISILDWVEFLNNCSYGKNIESKKLNQMVKDLQDEVEYYFVEPKTNIKKYKELLIKPNDNYSLYKISSYYKEIMEEINKDLKNKGHKQKQELLELRDKLHITVQNIEESLNEVKKLNERIQQIIDNTEFKALYNKEQNLFSIGYNESDNKLTNSYYDLLASEARLASYIAIARKEVPIKHWAKLGRSMTQVDNYKGLVSWTGTMFEYLMPLLVMKNYKNTLLDETYGTVLKSQQKYGKQRKVPWGTSESGFYSFDINLNYQYKAFGVPDLGLKRGLKDDMVISPYSSLLALSVDAVKAMENIKILISDGLEGEYGFYEAIDYTPERLPKDLKKGIVKSYMAHHQGMGLISIDNYLNKNIMQQRFHSDPVMASAEVLLQEKIPIRLIITKDYKEEIEQLKPIKKKNAYYTNTYNEVERTFPRCHLLSNSKYSVLLTEAGNGYSKMEDIQVTRWREDSLVGEYGYYIFVRNLNTNKVWSTTYAPLNEKPDRYSVKFSLDKAEYIRSDEEVNTHTEVIVSSEDLGEIRKVSLTNRGDKAVTLEVTSYFETVLTQQSADVAHPAFSNLFIKTEELTKYNSIIASRRPRTEQDPTLWISHTVIVKGETVGGLEYETNRERFIGRGRNISNPVAITEGLNNTTGPVLDPIMSMRRKIRIEASESVELAYITTMAYSKEEIIDNVRKYQKLDRAKTLFNLAYNRSIIETAYLDLGSEDIKLFEEILRHIIFLSPLRRNHNELIQKNIKVQSDLWAHGISGDLPIILVSITNQNELGIVKQTLSAHEYFRMKGLMIDLIILNEDESSYLQPLQELLQDTVTSKFGTDIQNKAGGIFIRNANIMSDADIVLLYTVAKIIIKTDKGSIMKQLKLPNDNFDDKTITFGSKTYNDIKYSAMESKLLFYNEYGGFNSKGDEYIIRLQNGQNTPAPWTNIIANKNFGFIVTENGSGFTWAENSRENKLTPWSNDPVSDPNNEIIYVRNEENGNIWSVTPLPIRKSDNYTIRHGIGYSEFNHTNQGIDHNLTVFVPDDKRIKISILSLENKTNEKRSLSLYYYIKPVLGVSDQVTKQFINTSVDSDESRLYITNNYNSDFKDQIVCMASSEKVKSYTGDRKEFIGSNKDIKRPQALNREGLSKTVGAGLDPCGVMQIEISIKPFEKKECTFLFGQSQNKEEIDELINAFKDIEKCKSAYTEAKNKWRELLDTIQVKTPDTTMNILMNNWLLYQTISCRIWGRSAFYQSGGAYGYRDQLQDSRNVMPVMPEATREQILIHCAHQFVEGDVQHWWHPVPGDKGIRTRFSDDLLWLPLVTAEYVIYTGDESILKEEVHFLEEEPLADNEDERYGIPNISEEKASVYEHCIRAIERGLNFGKHGIPLMGSGDWNDGMNTVGNKGKGESIWLGWFLYDILHKFADICSIMNDPKRGQDYKKKAIKIAEAIETHAWDGKWYRRAYFDDGTPLGSIENSECKIDSLAQSWAVISGGGTENRVKTAMNSVEQHLIKKEEGMILLFTPPFNNSSLEPGYIKSYVPGVRENGGQYTHAATWVINAFARMGEGDKAWQLFNLINPINHTKTLIETSNYKVEPYLVAADVYSNSHHLRRGGWTGYTGAAGWLYRVGLEEILGLKKRGDKLIIKPCIPNDWEGFTVKYRYKKTFYNIIIKNQGKSDKFVKYIIFDKQKIEEKYIFLKNDKIDHNVEVMI